MTKAWCSCFPGRSAKCKHAGALFIKINEERTEGKTDSEQAWHTPSSKMLDRYPKGQTVKQIFADYEAARPSKARKSSERSSSSLSSSREVYVQKGDDPFLQGIARDMEMCGLTDRMLYLSLTADTSSVQNDPIAPPPPIIPDRIKAIFHSGGFGSPDVETFKTDLVKASLEKSLKDTTLMPEINATMTSDECARLTKEYEDKIRMDLDSELMFAQDFYFNKIKGSDKEREHIFIGTIGQASNQEWHDIREFRISASIARQVGWATRKDTCLKHFGYNPQKPGDFKGASFDSDDLKYGRDTEPIAIERYKSQHPNYTVYESGVVICRHLPWLCATPDGLVIDENGDLVSTLFVGTGWPICSRTRLC